MALTKKELQALIAKCKTLRDGPDYQISEYIPNLINTVLDFQMKTAAVSSATDHFEKKHAFKTHQKLKDFVDKFPDTRDGNLQLANALWGNNHWSRAEFLRVLLKEFEKRDITDQSSLKRWVEQACFNSDIRGQFKTERHSIGIALFQWLRLRLGVDTVKPDVHIINFVSQAIGRKVSPNEAVDSLLQVAKETDRKAALLDAAIWHYQRIPKKTKEKLVQKSIVRRIRSPLACSAKPRHEAGDAISGTVIKRDVDKKNLDLCEIVINKRCSHLLPHGYQKRMNIRVTIGDTLYDAGIHETQKGVVWVSSVLYLKTIKVRLIDALSNIGIKRGDRIRITRNADGTYSLQKKIDAKTD